MVITHVKDELGDADSVESIHDRIARELKQIEWERRLGVTFLVARQGMRIGASSPRLARSHDLRPQLQNSDASA